MAFADIITFTRASTGTYFDAAGILRSASANAPRFSYDPTTLAPLGLMIEAASTNLLKYSEQADNAAWIKFGATVAANAATAPDGNTTADKLIETATTGAHYLDQTYNGTFTTGQLFSGSCFIEAAGRTSVRMNFYYAIGSTGGFAVYFDLENKVVLNQAAGIISAGVIDVGGGWLRCWFTAAVDTPAETRLLVRTLLATPGLISSYAGDGVSGVHLWGQQLEQGSLSSYIPTVAAAVTRAADNATLNTLTPWFNAGAGTLYIEATNVGTSGTTIAQLGTLSDRILTSVARTGQPGTGGNTLVGGVSQAAIQSAIGAPGQKVAYAYSTNDFACAVDGVLIGTDVSGSLPAVSSMLLGSNGSATTNCCIRNIQYFPVRLSNADLPLLTG